MLNSVYQAELCALRSVVKLFVMSDYRRMVVYSDSLSSILALQHAFPENMIIRDIFELMKNAPDKYVTLGWIKAHVGTVTISDGKRR